jgi:hypothetical protein
MLPLEENNLSVGCQQEATEACTTFVFFGLPLGFLLLLMEALMCILKTYTLNKDKMGKFK